MLGEAFDKKFGRFVKRANEMNNELYGISDEELFMDKRSEHIVKKSLDSPATLYKLLKSVSMYKKGVHNFIRMLNIRI